MFKKIKKFAYYWLPVLLLCLICFLQIIATLHHPTTYYLDETIVTTISRQPLPILFDTISAELHPPGFYLLLHYLPTPDIQTTRILLTLLVFSLYLTTLIFTRNEKLDQQYSLVLGLSLFFASYGFLELSTVIKQEMISFPLLLLHFLLFLKCLDAPPSQQIKWFASLATVSILLLMFGYLYFVVSLIALSIILFRNHKIFGIQLISSVVILVCVGWLYALGYDQILNNTNRFSWYGNSFNSSLRTLSVFLNGEVFLNFIYELPVVLFIAGICKLLFSLDSLKKPLKTIVPWILTFTAILILFSYFGELFVRIRYSAPVYFLLCLISGWGLQQIRYYKQIAIGICVYLVLLNSLFILLPKNHEIVEQQLREFITQQKYQTDVGLLDDHAQYPFIFRINNPQLKHIIPLNIFHPQQSSDFDTLTKEQIMYEGNFQDLGEEGFSQLLSETGLNHFIYKMKTLERTAYYDPHRRVLQTLARHCKLALVTPLTYRETLFEFNQCSFE